MALLKTVQMYKHTILRNSLFTTNIVNFATFEHGTNLLISLHNTKIFQFIFLFLFISDKVCIVDGRGGFRKTGRYCPILDSPDSKVECVLGLDRYANNSYHSGF